MNLYDTYVFIIGGRFCKIFPNDSENFKDNEYIDAM